METKINKITIEIPRGIKYISDWGEYTLPQGHCIVDKGVTGCGYTELGLRDNHNVVLCSPRKMLLENKRKQHQEKEDENILYLENPGTNEGIESRDYFHQTAANHILKCIMEGRPVKFMITYDSAHFLIDYLIDKGIIGDYYFIADEFQTLFLDSYFKPEIENSFLEVLEVCPNVIYLSATPMLDKYLVRVPQFANLTYYYIDWSKSGYVETLKIQRKHTNSLGAEVNKIIRNYLMGDFPTIISENGKVIESREAVFYVNSVKEIKRAIRDNDLSPDQVNVLCARTEANANYLKRAGITIGEIPDRNQPNKMFTFCTSTCYIGSDFYSLCASTYIFADPNIDSLALDISLDLPQIAGRQRLRENPFKNYVNIFYKTLKKDMITREAFEARQEERVDSTIVLLSDYENMSEKGKVDIINVFRSDIYLNKYCNNFIGVSLKTGRLVYNKLIEIANERAWEVSQKDYQDNISVTKALDSLEMVDYSQDYRDSDDRIVREFLDNQFYATNLFDRKLELYCNFMDEYKDNLYIRNEISYKIPDFRFYSYYSYFGTDGCRAMKFREGALSKSLKEATCTDVLRDIILSEFSVGCKYSLKDIKQVLSEIYRKLGIEKAPKATDLEEWFVMKTAKVDNAITKKRDNGFELLELK